MLYIIPKSKRKFAKYIAHTQNHKIMILDTIFYL